jgi:hypothetical protein
MDLYNEVRWGYDKWFLGKQDITQATHILPSGLKLYITKCGKVYNMLRASPDHNPIWVPCDYPLIGVKEL